MRSRTTNTPFSYSSLTQSASWQVAMKATQNNNCNNRKWTLHILLSSPLQRPTTVRTLQPHTAQVSFITPWLFQCGCSEPLCKPTFIVLLQAFTWRRRQNERKVPVWQNIDVFFYTGPCRLASLSAQKNRRFIVWKMWVIKLCSMVQLFNWLRYPLWSWHAVKLSLKLLTDFQCWEHPVAACLLTHPAGLWHVAEGFLLGHYLRCGDKHIALISSAIISSGQTGAEPAKAGRLASLLLTYLHCLTDSLFAHFHCGNKIRSNYKVPGLSVILHKPLGCLLGRASLAIKRSRTVISNDHTLILCWRGEIRARTVTSLTWPSRCLWKCNTVLFIYACLNLIVLLI